MDKIFVVTKNGNEILRTPDRNEAFSLACTNFVKSNGSRYEVRREGNIWTA